MEDIFLDYQNKIITGKSTLIDEYSSRKNIPASWVTGVDATVQELINIILDEFEEAGFDLEELPMENVLERFLTYKPVISVPVEYTQLQNAKTMIEKQIAATEVNEYTLDIIEKMKGTLDTISSAMKGYK